MIVTHIFSNPWQHGTNSHENFALIAYKIKEGKSYKTINNTKCKIIQKHCKDFQISYVIAEIDNKKICIKDFELHERLKLPLEEFMEENIVCPILKDWLKEQILKEIKEEYELIPKNKDTIKLFTEGICYSVKLKDLQQFRLVILNGTIYSIGNMIAPFINKNIKIINNWDGEVCSYDVSITNLHSFVSFDIRPI
jgi:hypothetical protein